MSKRAYKLAGKRIGRNSFFGIDNIRKSLELLYAVGEVLSVGQINEPNATSFSITEGSDNFEIDNSGNISFKNTPDYDVKRYYTLKARSNTIYIYNIEVYVSIINDDTVMAGNENMYNNTYIIES